MRVGYEDGLQLSGWRRICIHTVTKSAGGLDVGWGPERDLRQVSVIAISCHDWGLLKENKMVVLRFSNQCSFQSWLLSASIRYTRQNLKM